MAQEGLAARRAAVQVLTAVDEAAAFSPLSLHAAMERAQLDARDRSFAALLVYGTLRWRGRLDWELQHYLRQPFAKLPPPVRNVLRLGLYQLRFASSVPASAAVSTSVELSRRLGYPGLAQLVNAVLRRASATDPGPWLPDPAQDPTGYLSITGSHPRWLVERWLQRLGFDETEALLAANNESPPISLRTNLLRISAPDLLARLRAEGLPAEPSPLVPEGIRVHGFPRLEQSSLFQQGLFQVQDDSSMLVAYAVDPRPGQTVLDLCSAPGGKSTHLGERLGNTGRVIAFDPNPRKLQLVQEAARRLGLTNVYTQVADAREVRGPQAPRVLVDAPCTGLGVIRRRPELRWRQRPDHLPELVRLQKEILTAAARLVAPGGRLVYSTCTTEPEENEDNVEWFGRQFPEFTLEPIVPSLPEPACSRISSDRPYLRLWPHRHGSDGFFVARWRRQA
ncbi:MAG: 16S rRNA (cytosine(967)-C(5))-methyltransferase RsmB [Limnochordaceae bacterium]|nr:16S rRNA (cytosine(967)-C(5))-methyltransferase RsmB [Limnochordaceae bacterium]